MTEGDKRRSAPALRIQGAEQPSLPYVVELWDLPRTRVERIIARADTVLVAKAIFASAASEHPARRLVLRQGDRVIDERS